MAPGRSPRRRSPAPRNPGRGVQGYPVRPGPAGPRGTPGYRSGVGQPVYPQANQPYYYPAQQPARTYPARTNYYPARTYPASYPVQQPQQHEDPGEKLVEYIAGFPYARIVRVTGQGPDARPEVMISVYPRRSRQTGELTLALVREVPGQPGFTVTRDLDRIEARARKILALAQAVRLARAIEAGYPVQLVQGTRVIYQPEEEPEETPPESYPAESPAYQPEPQAPEETGGDTDGGVIEA